LRIGASKRRAERRFAEGPKEESPGDWAGS
jgi:hypothetical protein